MADTTSPEYMLTTVDNPFSPFTHFTEWNAFDEEKGYCTLALQARVAARSPELSDADQWLAEEEAMNEIVRENVSGMHLKVTREDIPRAA